MDQAITRKDLDSGLRFGVDDVRYFSWRLGHRSGKKFNRLELAGFNYFFHPGMTTLAIKLFRLRRLMHVGQLGYEHPPLTALDKSPVQIFRNTRFQHVCDVTAIGTLIARNVGFERVPADTLRLACISHDALATMGGDAPLEFLRDQLDEDEHYEYLLNSRPWSELQTRYEIPRPLLIATIQNRGPLGEVLNLADRLAYVCRDVMMYLNLYSPKASMPTAYGNQIRELVLKRPDTCTWWDSVRRDNHQVFIGMEGVDRFADFLVLRTLMFRDVYLGDRTKFIRTLVARVLLYFYETGRLNREQMFNLDDRHVEKLITETVGFSPRTFRQEVFGRPCVQCFSTRELAHQREVELWRERRTSFTMISKVTLKTGTDHLVETPEGIKTFHSAFPDRAEQIERLANPAEPFRLYSLDQPKANSFTQELLDYQLRREANC